MSTSPEENAIDQSLRDAFRDYDLPPDAHPRVWEGVTERISTIPPAGNGLPYHLILPLTAMLGIGVGWLLPRPATWNAHPSAQVTQVLPRTVTMLAPTAPVTTDQLPLTETTDNKAATPSAEPTRQLVRRPRRAVPSASQPVRVQPAASVVAPDSTSTPTVTVASAEVAPVVAAPLAPADSAPTVAMVEPIATPPAATAPASTPQTQAVSARPAKAAKPIGTNEKMTYRKLSQRQPEGGNGIRRWFTHLFQSVRHLLS